MIPPREKIYQALRDAELDARYLSQESAPCTAPYLVVRDGGESMDSRLTRHVHTIVTGFAPTNALSALTLMMNQARTALEPIKSIRLAGGVTEETVDEKVDAVSSSLHYTSLCGT